MWQYHKTSMNHSKIIDTFDTYQYVLVLNFGDEILIRWGGCNNPNFGPIQISLSKPKFGFGSGSFDLCTSIFFYISKTPKVLKIFVFSLKNKKKKKP